MFNLANVLLLISITEAITASVRLTEHKHTVTSSYPSRRFYQVQPSHSLFPKGIETALRRANSEHVVVPFGTGICGHVAQTKEAVVLSNAYDDPRFNAAVDAKTGYTTRYVLDVRI